MVFLKLGENRRLRDLEVFMNLKYLDIGNEGLRDLERFGFRIGN